MTIIIFDCDGVLVDSEILHAQVEAEVGREFLAIERDTMSHSRAFAGRGLKNVYKTWEQESGKPLPSNINEILLRRKDEIFSTQIKALPNIIEAIEALADMPRCVATGSPLPTLKVMLQVTGLYKYFEPNFFTAEMVAQGKPAPDIFLLAAQQMGVSPKDCFVVEDSIHGVQAGVAAGMKILGFSGGSHCQPNHSDMLLEAGAICVLQDMLDLAPAIRRLLLNSQAKPALPSGQHRVV